MILSVCIDIGQTQCNSSFCSIDISFGRWSLRPKHVRDQRLKRKKERRKERKKERKNILSGTLVGAD
jgi:hypothetical protein